jgi:hypothetical protein
MTRLWRSVGPSSFQRRRVVRIQPTDVRVAAGEHAAAVTGEQRAPLLRCGVTVTAAQVPWQAQRVEHHRVQGRVAQERRHPVGGDGPEHPVVQRPEVQVAAGAGGVVLAGMDGEGRLDAGLPGRRCVGGERPAADLLQCERHERGPRWDPERAVGRLGILGELVEELVGDGVQHVGHADGVLAHQLAPHEQEVRRGRQREAIGEQVPIRIVAAVGIGHGGEVLDVCLPDVEDHGLRRLDQVVEHRRQRVGVALVDGAGEHAGVVAADASAVERPGDRRECHVVGQTTGERETATRHADREAGLTRQPLGRGRTAAQVGVATAVELGQRVVLGRVQQAPQLLELDGHGPQLGAVERVHRQRRRGPDGRRRGIDTGGDEGRHRRMGRFRFGRTRTVEHVSERTERV